MFQISIIALLIVPIIGSFLIYFFRQNINKREAMSFLTAIPLFGIVLNLFLQEKVTSEVITFLNFFPGVSLSFFYDHLSIVFAFVASFLWIITTMYSIGYMSGQTKKIKHVFIYVLRLLFRPQWGLHFRLIYLRYLFFMNYYQYQLMRLLGITKVRMPVLALVNMSFFLFGGSIGLAYLL